MNKTLNQLINQLHLDPKKEAAARKLVENVGGINDSTPVVTEVSGNELLPININGKNKAVSAAALVNGAKEVYSIKTSEFKTPEDFNNLEAAVDAGNIIIVDDVIVKGAGKGSSNDKPIIMITIDFILHEHSGDEHIYRTVTFNTVFRNDGTYEKNINQMSLKSGCDGTKFLSDDGTYKEVSGGSGPVIIEYPFESTEAVTLTDEQIEAFKNSNVKIKITDASMDFEAICIPYAYSISGNNGALFIRMSGGSTIIDSAFIVDIANKTIVLQSN